MDDPSSTPHGVVGIVHINPVTLIKENTMNDAPMNLNTLFAAIVDTLATAVAAKIKQPEPADVDVAALTEAVTGSDAFSDAITSEVDDKVDSAIDYYLDHSANIPGRVSDALGDIDLVDYMDIGDLSSQVAESNTLARIIEREVSERVDTAVDEIDMAAPVSEYLSNNTSVVTDTVESYLDDHLQELINAELKAITDTIMAAKVTDSVLDEMKIRAIVREELSNTFSDFAGRLSGVFRTPTTDKE